MAEKRMRVVLNGRLLLSRYRLIYLMYRVVHGGNHNNNYTCHKNVSLPRMLLAGLRM